MSTRATAAAVSEPGTEHRLGGWPVRETLAAATVLAALVYAHADALAGMVHLWNVSPMYSYGFSVPLVSAYLLWTRRAALASLTPRPSYAAGIPVVGAGVLMLAAGRAGNIQALQQVAFLVSLIGTALLVFGVSYVRVGWAALAYLLLMVPVWDGLTEPLHEGFQLRSATIGVAVLRLVGIPAYREGNIIALPDVTLEVARACSGVNYLIAVVALGLPMAYLFLRGFWRRVALIASAVVLAGLSNGLRVALIGVLAHLEIGSPLHGPFHVLHGLFVAGVGYVALFAGLRLLSTNDSPRRDSVAATSARPSRWSVPRLPASIAVLLFAGIGSGILARDVRPVPLGDALEIVPLRLGDWEASGPGDIDTAIAEAWPTSDVRLERRYRSSAGSIVDVLVAYLATQDQGREIAGYRTAPLHRRAMPIAITAPSGPGFEANLVRTSSGDVEALFWYQLGPAVERTASRAKLRTMWNALTLGTNHAAVVVLSPRRSAYTQPVDAVHILPELAGLVHDALSGRLSQSVAAVAAGQEP